jgi:hypothetical protein
MKNTVFCLFAIGLCLVALSPASASVFTAALTGDGKVDTIQDNSVSIALDLNQNNIQDQGDVVISLVRWEKDGNKAFGNTALSLAAFEVTSNAVVTNKSVGGYDNALGFTLDAANVTVANELALEGGLALLGVNVDLTVGENLIDGLLSNLSNLSLDTVGTIFSLTNGIDLTTVTLAQALASLNTDPWTLDATYGVVTPTDFFHALLVDVDGDGKFTYQGPNSDINLGGLVEGDTIGLEAGGFSAIINNVSPTLIPVSFKNLYGVSQSAEIAVTNNTTLLVADDQEKANGWYMADQAVVKLNPIPEPASVIVWSLLAMVVGFCTWRRR